MRKITEKAFIGRPYRIIRVQNQIRFHLASPALELKINKAFHGLILGKSGCGKTYLGRVYIEELYEKDEFDYKLSFPTKISIEEFTSKKPIKSIQNPNYNLEQWLSK
ncbi:hypothetical protein [Candidatus Harpocratesius sp.]